MLLLTLSVLSGCQQRAGNKLLGRWEGRPDSAAKRAERDAKKYGDKPAKKTDKKDVEGSGSKSSDAIATVQVTDWERYDVTLVMDFVSGDRVEMSLNGGQQIEGQWKVLATTPSGCTIEVETQPEKSAPDDTQLQPVRRRFELLFDQRDGKCVGYQLTEVGADALLGALYFQRPVESK